MTTSLDSKRQSICAAQERINQDPNLKATRDAIYSFNANMDIFEAETTLATWSSIRDKFDEIKRAWSQLKSGSTAPDLQNSYEIIDLSMNHVEKRVSKFVEENKHVTNWAVNTPNTSKYLLMLRVSYEGYITFNDAPGDCANVLSNTWPSPLNFENKQYSCVADVIKDIQSREPLRFSSEQDLDFMMNILRAKFDQNPRLKEMLMATGTAYLVKHSFVQGQFDAIWGIGKDGNGQNLLGICLMKLREEYGGTGVVEKPAKYLSSMALIWKVPEHVNSSSSSASTSSLAGRCDLCNGLPSQGLEKGKSTCKNCADMVLSVYSKNV